MKKLNVLILFLVFLTGCSIARMNPVKSHDNDYLQSKTIPPLQIPQGFRAQNLGQDYPIPDHISSDNSTVPSQVPPGSHP